MKPGTIRQWRDLGLTMLVLVPYMGGFFWLQGKADYPEGFGLTLSHRGKTAIVQEWWNSYLLLERGKPWDIALFAYMWPVMLALLWLIWRLCKIDRQRNPELEVEA